MLEVGPGLGSLTLALLDVAAAGRRGRDRPGARRPRCPPRSRRTRPARRDRFEVVPPTRCGSPTLPGPPPTALVANLPYNVSVPGAAAPAGRCCPSLRHGLVMVQAEVADRLAAAPGSKVYGVPSVKAAWYADVRRAGAIGRNVFWPAPNVDSGLVAWTRREPPATTATREQVFAVVDAAFAQRRKTLRAALAGLAGSRRGRRAARLRGAGSTRWRAASRCGVERLRRDRRGARRRGASGAGRRDRAASVTVRAPAKINLHLGVGPAARRRLPPAGHRLPGGRPLRRGHRRPSDDRRRLDRVDGDRRRRPRRGAARRRQHRRPRRRLLAAAPRRRPRGAPCTSPRDPGRRRHGRRLGRRGRRAGGLRPRCGDRQSRRRRPARARRRARQRRPVRAGRRHRARHRPRRAGHARRWPAATTGGCVALADRGMSTPAVYRRVRPAARGRRRCPSRACPTR